MAAKDTVHTFVGLLSAVERALEHASKNEKRTLGGKTLYYQDTYNIGVFDYYTIFYDFLMKFFL